LVEPLSIDEAFLDVSGCIQLFGSAKNIGEKLKYKIYENQALTASVGIAPNKFLAKIASDLEKPDGLVIVDENKIQEFLDPLPLSRLWGAGKKTIEKLNNQHIYTIGDLSKLPKDILQQKFGKLGNHFYQLSRGLDTRPVEPGHEVKSVSNETTFSNDLYDRQILSETLLHLCEKVGYRMRQKNLKGKTVQLKLRYEGFDTIIRNKTLKNGTANTDIIFKVIWKLFELNYDNRRKVRLVGVGMSGFKQKTYTQLSLFDQSEKKTSELDIVEDLVRQKFGKNAINRAEGMRKSKDSDMWFE
jgi:nucleotidyltransferase/DNA polymerase involved in DNA repair